MNPSQIVEEASTKMQAASAHFAEELKKLRTGRAHASMLDGVTIEAYGTQMPLNQAATVSAPEAQLLQVSPFDPNNLQVIAAAIRNNPTLGLNPTDDGRVIRVPVPPLTEERRREIVKVANQRQEDGMVALRNVRHDAMDAVSQAKKDKLLGEDDAKRLEKQIDEAMNKVRADMEALARSKEADIMSL